MDKKYLQSNLNSKFSILNLTCVMSHLKFIQRATMVVLLMIAGFKSQIAAQTCPTSNEITITVVPDLSVTAQPVDLTECVGGTNPISVTVAGGTGVTSYQWQSSTNGTTWTSITGATSASYTPESTVAATTYYHVLITSAGTGCDAVTSNSSTVIITPNLSVTAQPTDLTECVGGTSTIGVTVAGGASALTYQWQESTNGGANWSDISGATAATYAPPSTTVGSKLYRAVISSGSNNGCNPLTSASATVTITPELSISAQPLAITECLGGTMALDVTVSGATGTVTYQWQESADGSTWADISTATAASYTPNSGTVGTKYYRTVINASGNGCDAITSTSATVNVTPELSITAQPANLTECIGGTSPINVTVTGATGAITYQWQSSPDGTNWTDIAGATASAYTPNSATAGATQYHVIIKAAGNGCDDVTSASSTVTITPELSITAQPTDITECIGGTLPINVTVIGATGAVTYQWQSSTNNGATWTDISGATAAAYTPASTAASTTQYHAIIKAAGNGCDDITSASATVTVTPQLAISAQPTNITECQGGTLPLDVTVAGATGAVTYQWQESPDGNTWTPIAGATAASYTPSGSSVGTKYYRAVVSASGNGCDPVNSTSATVTITPDLSIPTQLVNITECIGGSEQLVVVAAGGTGTISYAWESSLDGVSWSPISGATAATYTPSSATAGTVFYRVAISATGNGCGTITSAAANVTISPDLNITAQPTDLTECVGGTNTIDVTVTGATGTVTYQWQEFVAGSWTDVSGATAASYTPASATAGTSQYRAIISATGNGCGAVTSASSTVTITPELNLTAQPNNITQCVGGTLPLTVAATGATGAVTYQWQSSNDGSTWADITGATAATYTPSSATAGTLYYRVVVNASGNGCDAVTSGSATVVITPDLSISAQPVAISECIGGNLPITVTVAGGTGTISYQWESSPDGTTWTAISGATAATYTPSSLAAGENFYHVLVSASGNGCDPITSTSAKVTVVAKPLINITAAITAVCVGGGSELTATTTGGLDCTIQWQSKVGTGVFTDIPGANGTTYVTPAMTQDTKYTAKFICNGNGCCQ